VAAAIAAHTPFSSAWRGPRHGGVVGQRFAAAQQQVAFLGILDWRADIEHAVNTQCAWSVWCSAGVLVVLALPL
jgi:hypothetical protein